MREGNITLDFDSLLSDSIASPPSLYLKLQDALENPETTFADYAQIISADTAFAFRILKIVNSPFYGYNEPINSIAHAVDILGTGKLTDLAIAALVIDKFKGIPKDLLVMDDFWRHSIACGLGAQAIARTRKEPDSERFYLSGLLHDIGSLLLYQKEPIKSRMLLEEARKRKKNLFAIENQYLGFDHAKLGGALLRKWRLPQMFVDAAQWHNHPAQAQDFPQIARAVHLADSIAYEMKLGTSGEPEVPPIIPDLLKALKLSEEDLQGIRDTIMKDFQQMAELFLGA